MHPPPGYHSHRCPKCGRRWVHTACGNVDNRETHMCPKCGFGPVWNVERLLGSLPPPGFKPPRASGTGDVPPPSYYDYERPRPANVSRGPGLGFYIKMGLVVGGIFGVAATAQAVAET